LFSQNTSYLRHALVAGAFYYYLSQF